jgi:hypothetical protein
MVLNNRKSALKYKFFAKRKSAQKNLLENFPRGFGDSAGVRTQDPNIKSVVLYQLSYEINLSDVKSKNLKEMF